jgi:hypothetical protein
MRRLALGALFFFATACPSQVRRFTYAPEFQYIARADLRTVMGKMARRVAQLDRLLRPERLAGPRDQERVKVLLRELEGLAASLDAGGRRTNHPVLDRQLPAFRTDLAAARRAAEAAPPSTFLAGGLVGSCMACHRAKR